VKVNSFKSDTNYKVLEKSYTMLHQSPLTIEREVLHQSKMRLSFKHMHSIVVKSKLIVPTGVHLPD
jgi:hypothetical protein